MKDTFIPYTLQLVSATKQVLTDKQSTTIQIKEEATCCVVNSIANITINGSPYSIRECTSLQVRKGATIDVEAVERNTTIYVVQFSIQPNPEHGNTIPCFQHTQIPIGNLPPFIAILEHLTKKVELSYETYFKRQSQLYEFMSRLHDELHNSVLKSKSKIASAIAFMQEHYKEDIYIGLLANQASMSLSSFSKAFKKETGKTPSEYLVQLRMSEAKEILCNTNSTIKETAQFVGFQDEFYFSKVFKKYEGIAPTIFVRQSSERIAIVSQMFLQDHLLSLGVKPVAAPCYPKTFRTKNGFPPYISNKLSGTKPINVEEAVQMEEVLKVSPHTIFKMNLHHEPSRDDWKQGTDAIHIQHLPTWDSYLLTLASHTKRETKAEIVLSDMENRERAARETLLPVTRKGKWVVAWVRNNEIRLYGRSGHALSDLFYEKLGFIPDEKIKHEGFQYIQLEDLVHLNPERILFMWSDTSSIQNLKRNKLWNELRAVNENNVFVPKSTDWDPWGPYGRDYTIQGFVSFFRSFC